MKLVNPPFFFKKVRSTTFSFYWHYLIKWSVQFYPVLMEILLVLEFTLNYFCSCFVPRVRVFLTQRCTANNQKTKRNEKKKKTKIFKVNRWICLFNCFVLVFFSFQLRLIVSYIINYFLHFLYRFFRLYHYWPISCPEWSFRSDLAVSEW